MPAELGEILRRSAAPSRSGLTRKMRLLLRTIRSQYGMDAAFISQFIGEVRRFEVVDSSVNLRRLGLVAGASGPLQDSYCYGVAIGAIPELIRNAQAAPEVAHLSATSAFSVGAHISVPIRRSNGEVYGTLCAFSHTADDTLTSRDLTMFRLCADFLAYDIEQIEAHDLQAQSQRDLIERVVSRRAFTIALQPIVALTDRSTVGFEALSRFLPEMGAPERVFELAAQVGLAEDLELAVLGEAISRFDLSEPGPYLSINVSPCTILGQRLERLLDEAPRDRIVIELTEHAKVNDYEQLVQRTDALRQQGVRIAVDDAGAGYASFRHVLLVRPDIIKLDRSLIGGIDTSPEKRLMAKSLTDYAAAMRAVIVAEGIERDEELDVLRHLSVPMGQGYLLGRPQTLTSPRLRAVT